MTSNLHDNTYIYGSNAAYIAEIYEQYLINPSNVDASWQDYFNNLGDSKEDLQGDFNGGIWGKAKTQIIGVTQQIDEKRNTRSKNGRRKTDTASQIDKSALDSIHAHMLIRAYRVRGHLIATLDPLAITVKKQHPELDPARYGFSENDYDHDIILDGWLGKEKSTLRDILTILQKTYSSNIAVEFAHIQSLERKEWLEQKMEGSLSTPSLTADEKKSTLKKLIEVVGFEEFLHKKFPGAKRFSAEGGEALMPSMEAAVETAAKLGVKEVVLGMPHRGRLNVLTAFMGKEYTAMLSEFQGNLATPDFINSSGDVKYHLGLSTDKKFGDKQVHLSLTANPSHLEAVNPVVIGKVRAKQDQYADTNRDQVMGILLHGDAAFCGQGVVAETLSLNDLEGYETGGTIHIVVNNQVGFTTSPSSQHTSPYPTDVAMMIQAPIFHVNGDDAEAVVHISRIAAEFRQKFKKDVIIDIWCYRKHGHNEGDEPRWTQPKMYAVIDKKQTPREIYAQQLIAEKIITKEEVEKLKNDFHTQLEAAYEGSNSYKPTKADMLEGKWGDIKTVQAGEKPKIETGVDLKTLKKLGKSLSEKPESITLHKGVERVMNNRAKMIETGNNLDWAMGEALAFASLLEDGNPVRISGQDVIRGTFSHRHSGVWDQNSEEIYFPLNNLNPNSTDNNSNKTENNLNTQNNITTAKYEAVNSNLSEFAVLGYEYGYSSAEPNALTIWEGQFGDFVNGAQVIIDQFISSAEVKWLRMSGLVMLLPHGYEGQGPEHSSARIERFLQQSAEDNWIIANCTTPANYFHILRRQLHREFRKPLIIFTPKSLLRHKLAQSSLADLATGTMFRRIIPEINEDGIDNIVADNKIRKVILCTGKIYYDILEQRREQKIKDIAIIRLEQLYPFPHEALLIELKKYKNADVIWAQEEPENMGAWSFVDRRIEKTLLSTKNKTTRPSYVGRDSAAATACGYMRIHKKEQESLIKEALS